MIKITNDMVDRYLHAKGSGQTIGDYKRGLEAVAPLIARAYQEPTHGRCTEPDSTVDDAVDPVRAEALRNAVHLWARSMANDTEFGMDRTSTVLTSAKRFHDWLKA